MRTGPAGKVWAWIDGATIVAAVAAVAATKVLRFMLSPWVVVENAREKTTSPGFCALVSVA
jgi:spermidine/putrescine-binding protein